MFRIVSGSTKVDHFDFYIGGLPPYLLRERLPLQLDSSVLPLILVLAAELIASLGTICVSLAQYLLFSIKMYVWLTAGHKDLSRISSKVSSFSRMFSGYD
jgi:hypothetical protein